MFSEDIIIDRNKLDEECSRAPAFFDYWQNQESNLKAQLENCEADISREIRSLDEDEIRRVYNVPKVTEGAINSIIKTDRQYKMLRNRFLSAEASRKSWEKKISMLDTLAKLHGQSYFSKIESKKETLSFLAEEIKKRIALDMARIKNNKKEKPRRPR